MRLFEMSKLQEEEARAKEAMLRAAAAAADHHRRQMEDEERSRRIAEAVNKRVGRTASQSCLYLDPNVILTSS